MFDRFKLKVLQDPKHIYGNAESIHTVAWKGFSEKDPFAARLLRNIRLTDAEISSLMTALEEARTTERQAARKWMEEHKVFVEKNSTKNKMDEVLLQPSPHSFFSVEVVEK